MSEDLLRREDSTPFLLFDKLDDELIKAELEGKLPEVLTYHFKQAGQDVWGISKAGVDEAKAQLSRQGEVIRELEVTVDASGSEAYFNVKAGRYAISKDGKEILLDTAFGFKRQPKKFDTGKDNPFWYEQGGVKAARNACMRLIPKSIIQGVIEFAKAKGKVREVSKPEKEFKPLEPEKVEPPKAKESFADIMKRECERIGEGAFYELIRKWDCATIEQLGELPRDVQIRAYKTISEIK